MKGQNPYTVEYSYFPFILSESLPSCFAQQKALHIIVTDSLGELIPGSGQPTHENKHQEAKATILRGKPSWDTPI